MAYFSRYSPNNRYSQEQNRLSDRDMLQDMLTTGKYMSQMYEHAVMQATSDTARNIFEQLQQEEHDNAQMLTSFMQQQGWYTAGANRQLSGRRFPSRQRLSGGTGQADSRYAVTSGTRNLGRHMTSRPSQSRQSLADHPL